jgi:hypothetical protein
MPSVRHELLVRHAKEKWPGLQVKGFSKALVDILQEDWGEPDPGDLEEGQTVKQAMKEAREITKDEVLMSLVGKKPDGFWIDRENREIIVVEAEVTSMVRDEKLRAYADLWDYLDFYEWEMKLMVVGGGNHIGEISLRDAYYEFHFPGSDGRIKHAVQYQVGQRGPDETTEEEKALATLLVHNTAAVLTDGLSDDPKEAP